MHAFIISFVSVMSAANPHVTLDRVNPYTTVHAELAVPAGWTCHYESLAQSFEERAGRTNAVPGQVRVCESRKAGGK